MQSSLVVPPTRLGNLPKVTFKSQFWREAANDLHCVPREVTHLAHTGFFLGIEIILPFNTSWNVYITFFDSKNKAQSWETCLFDDGLPEH